MLFLALFAVIMCLHGSMAMQVGAQRSLLEATPAPDEGMSSRIVNTPGPEKSSLFTHTPSVMIERSYPVAAQWD